jgi:hypothetical protein
MTSLRRGPERELGWIRGSNDAELHQRALHPVEGDRVETVTVPGSGIPEAICGRRAMAMSGSRLPGAGSL